MAKPVLHVHYKQPLDQDQVAHLKDKVKAEAGSHYFVVVTSGGESPEIRVVQ